MSQKVSLTDAVPYVVSHSACHTLSSSRGARGLLCFAMIAHFIARTCSKAACCMNFTAAGVFVWPARVSMWIFFGTGRAL